MTIVGASIVWLPVTDLDRAVQFYCDKLGFNQNHHDDDWAQLEVNGFRIGLNASASESPHGDGGAVIAFSPEAGLDETVRQMRDGGVQFAGDISEHPWGRIATFKDPDGNDLQLYEAPTA